MSNIAPSIQQPAAGAVDELAAVEHPAHLPVGAHDPVLDGERVARLDALGDLRQQGRRDRRDGRGS